MSADASGPWTLRGDETYRLYCATCHGVRGDGRGPTAPFLSDPPPRDFTRGVFKFKSTPAGSLPTSDDLVRTIRRGVPGTSMPAWDRVLGDDQVRGVASYVQGFFAGPSAEPQALRTVEVPAQVPVSSAESLARGRNVYLMMRCWGCHGTDARGHGPDAEKQRDHLGRKVQPRDLTAGVFRAGGEPRDLYRTLATGIDGTPMVAVYGDPATFERAFFVQRATSVREVAEQGRLDAKERALFEMFVAGLPTMDVYDEMGEPEQEALLSGWRWDLVHYVRSLSQAGSWWRGLLGLSE